MKKWTSLAFLLCLAAITYGEVKLPAIFGDNMVIQQKSKVAVWGWADAGEKVEVKGSWMWFGTSVKADKDGKWRVKIDTPSADGKPLTLTIKGSNTITLSNVLAGEVWVCSGQSNMEFTFAMLRLGDAIKDENNDNIRLFTVQKKISAVPLDDCAGTWELTRPGALMNFSAVAYYFGKELYSNLNVPIGLINTSWGGTPAESWTSEEGLAPFAHYVNTAKQYQEFAKNPGKLNEMITKAVSEWEQKIAAIDPGTQGNWQDPQLDISDWKEMEQPTFWAGSDLEPVDGIVWFRRVTNLPPSWARNPMELHLGPIDDIDTVWVNGVKIGGTVGYNKERKYVIPTTALRVGPNVIAVRVVDTGGEGGFNGSKEQMRIGPVGADVKTCATLAGAWKYKASLSNQPLPGAPNVDGGFNANTPTSLFNGMIQPLVPYGIAGAIWYQGESNIGRSDEYAQLLPAMISDWRRHWGIGDFPFYWVQIAPYVYSGSGNSESAYLREAQVKALAAVKNGGMASTMDIGEERDIHPKNKVDVGKRLALNALAKNYNKKVAAFSGPMYKLMKIEGQKIRLSFDYTNGGLVAREGQLSEFVIAGEDKVFVPAQAVIEGDTVVVWSDQVTSPVAVRYAWTNWSTGPLGNKEGLPASSFRTDDWK